MLRAIRGGVHHGSNSYACEFSDELEVRSDCVKDVSGPLLRIYIISAIVFVSLIALNIV